MKIHNIFNRKQNSYKNNFGHVLIIAGSYNMPGAGVLCANSAITSGAGLVTFVFPKSAYPVIAQNIKPEIMLLPLEEKNGTFSKSAATDCPTDDMAIAPFHRLCYQQPSFVSSRPRVLISISITLQKIRYW